MAITIKGKTYRNIQEQVEKNMQDIIDMKKKGYQEYTPGDNIQISDEGVISATDTTYSEGDGISISDSNVISIDMNYVKGNVTSYTSGDGISFSYDAEEDEFTISIDSTVADKTYVDETVDNAIEQLPSQKFLHRINFTTEDSITLAFNVITDSATAWIKTNIPTIPSTAIDMTYLGSFSNSTKFYIQTGSNAIQIRDAQNNYLVDYDTIDTIEDRVQPL